MINSMQTTRCYEILIRQCAQLETVSLTPALCLVLQKWEGQWHKPRLSLAQTEALKGNKGGKHFLTTRFNFGR